MDIILFVFIGMMCLMLGMRVFNAEEQNKVFNKRKLPLKDDIRQIIINKLTSDQYAAEVAAGTLSPDEFYILTDWTDEVGSKINDNKISTSSTYSSSKIDSTYAKTEYVDTKVSGLVNSAPETLDTLKELSDALGGDANFATTIATQIGNKQDKLTAGNGITIVNNVISSTATGGSSSVTFRTWEA